MKKLLVGTVLVLALCSSVFSYSYSAFAFSSGKQTLAIVPYIYAWNSDGVWGGGDICASYGLTDKTDVFLDVNYLYGAGAGTPGWFGMVRYDFGDTKIVARESPDPIPGEAAGFHRVRGEFVEIDLLRRARPCP